MFAGEARPVACIDKSNGPCRKMFWKQNLQTYQIGL